MADNGRTPDTVGGISQERLEELRRENEAKPRYAPYSIATHDAARDLWLSGWTDERIAEALGIGRRETVTEWARKENWLELQRELRRRATEKFIDSAAQKVAEQNAEYLQQVDAVLARLYRELASNADLAAKSVEGAARAVFEGITLRRRIQGLDQPEQVTINAHVSKVDEFQKLLERVKGQPDQLRRLMELQRQRIELEAEMRNLVDSEFSVGEDA